MNRQQYLLAKLSEECNEVAQIALKTQQFGMLEKHPDLVLNNKERIHEELNDLLAIVEMLNEDLEFGFNPDNIQILQKKRKVNHYYKYSQELGEVE